MLAAAHSCGAAAARRGIFGHVDWTARCEQHVVPLVSPLKSKNERFGFSRSPAVHPVVLAVALNLSRRRRGVDMLSVAPKIESIC